MATVFNPFTGNPDYISLDTTAGDARYLKLDCSNSPLTGNLVFTAGLDIRPSVDSKIG